MLKRLFLQLRARDIHPPDNLFGPEPFSLFHALRMLNSSAAHIFLRIFVGPVAALSYKSHQRFLGNADSTDGENHQQDKEGTDVPHNPLQRAGDHASDNASAAACRIVITDAAVRLGADKELHKAAEGKEHHHASDNLYYRPAASPVGLIKAHAAEKQQGNQISEHAKNSQHDSAEKSSECADQAEVAEKQQCTYRKRHDNADFRPQCPAVVIRLFFINLGLLFHCPGLRVLLSGTCSGILSGRLRILRFSVSGCHKKAPLSANLPSIFDRGSPSRVRATAKESHRILSF